MIAPRITRLHQTFRYISRPYSVETKIANTVNVFPTYYLKIGDIRTREHVRHITFSGFDELENSFCLKTVTITNIRLSNFNYSKGAKVPEKIHFRLLVDVRTRFYNRNLKACRTA